MPARSPKRRHGVESIPSHSASPGGPGPLPVRPSSVSPRGGHGWAGAAPLRRRGPGHGLRPAGTRRGATWPAHTHRQSAQRRRDRDRRKAQRRPPPPLRARPPRLERRRVFGCECPWHPYTACCSCCREGGGAFRPEETQQAGACQSISDRGFRCGIYLLATFSPRCTNLRGNN
jgi:hypothetical protein